MRRVQVQEASPGFFWGRRCGRLEKDLDPTRCLGGAQVLIRLLLSGDDMDSHYSDQEASVESPLLSKGDNSSYTRPMPKRSLSRPVQVLSFALAAAVSLLLFCAWGSTRTPKSDSKKWPTDIGYAGPTPSAHQPPLLYPPRQLITTLPPAGSEAFAAATSYPHNTDSYPLTSPNALGVRRLPIPGPPPPAPQL